jgi:hypothetical protein
LLHLRTFKQLCNIRFINSHKQHIILILLVRK